MLLIFRISHRPLYFCLILNTPLIEFTQPCGIFLENSQFQMLFLVVCIVKIVLFPTNDENC